MAARAKTSKAAKTATIASLVRAAARSEVEFLKTITDVYEVGDTERVWEFFDRLNVPRSVSGEGGLHEPLSTLEGPCLVIWDFATEHKISQGVQKYMDRHERKIKWHSTHPSLDGLDNVLLLMRGIMMVTNLRLRRLMLLLNSKEELTPIEWRNSREIMNKSYLSFRNYLNLLSTNWIDAMQSAVPREALSERLGAFHEIVDKEIRALEDLHDKLEARRMDLTVIPEEYPPVKPPPYFGGDLLGRGPWKQFWNSIDNLAHHFREFVI
jgi:hypothetical protein